MGEEIKITRAERRVLKLMEDGLDASEIADRLCVAKRTVDYHLNHLFGKFDVHSMWKLYHAARRKGIIE